MATTLREKIRTCNTLPSLPAAALYVLQIAGKEEADVLELGKTIAQDPALSLKVLRAVNSPFYGLGQKVSSVQQAVVLLGMHSVKTLVLGFSLVNNLRNKTSPGFNHLEYWRRSMYAATAARIIAGKHLPGHEDDCFVAALLMDIGALILDQLLGEQYDTLYEKTSAHSELMALEAHHLGMTHAEAGGILAEYWSLPEELKVPMESHHAPQEVKSLVLNRITQVVWLAGRCADVFVNKGKTAESICAVRHSFRSLYQIDELQADSLMCLIAQKTHDLAALFDVRLTAEKDFDDIVKQAHQRLLELSMAEKQDSGDKRRASRVRRDGKIMIVPCARGVLKKPIPVRLRDVSACGIGITYTQPLEKGSEFVIQLPINGETKTLLYAVTRVDALADLWQIGGELTSVLRPDVAEGVETNA
jgi:two-component system, cell cycle response regulator